MTSPGWGNRRQPGVSWFVVVRISAVSRWSGQLRECWVVWASLNHSLPLHSSVFVVLFFAHFCHWTWESCTGCMHHCGVFIFYWRVFYSFAEPAKSYEFIPPNCYIFTGAELPTLSSSSSSALADNSDGEPSENGEVTITETFVGIETVESLTPLSAGSESSFLIVSDSVDAYSTLAAAGSLATSLCCSPDPAQSDDRHILNLPGRTLQRPSSLSDADTCSAPSELPEVTNKDSWPSFFFLALASQAKHTAISGNALEERKQKKKTPETRKTHKSKLTFIYHSYHPSYDQTSKLIYFHHFSSSLFKSDKKKKKKKKKSSHAYAFFFVSVPSSLDGCFDIDSSWMLASVRSYTHPSNFTLENLIWNFSCFAVVLVEGLCCQTNGNDGMKTRCWLALMHLLPSSGTQGLKPRPSPPPGMAIVKLQLFATGSPPHRPGVCVCVCVCCYL